MRKPNANSLRKSWEEDEIDFGKENSEHYEFAGSGWEKAETRQCCWVEVWAKSGLEVFMTAQNPTQLLDGLKPIITPWSGVFGWEEDEIDFGKENSEHPVSEDRKSLKPGATVVGSRGCF